MFDLVGNPGDQFCYDEAYMGEGRSKCFAFRLISFHPGHFFYFKSLESKGLPLRGLSFKESLGMFQRF